MLLSRDSDTGASKLGVGSGMVVAACIQDNATLTSLKCAALAPVVLAPPA